MIINKSAVSLRCNFTAAFAFNVQITVQHYYITYLFNAKINFTAFSPTEIVSFLKETDKIDKINIPLLSN